MNYSITKPIKPLKIAQTLRCDGKFDSAHFLQCHNGKCKNLHGHTWNVEFEITIMREFDLSKGMKMILDFGDLKKLVDSLDHKNLNEVLNTDNPTAEFLSAYFLDKAMMLLWDAKILHGVLKMGVKVGEGGSSTIESSIDHIDIERLFQDETDTGVVSGC